LRRSLDKFPEIVARLGGMTDRFTSMLDLRRHRIPAGDELLDELPAASQIGATRVGGVDIHKPRIRAALGALIALAVAPDGFTVSEFTTKVQAMTGQTEADYTIRQAAYDLRKLRGKRLVVKLGRSRRHRVPPEAARIITVLTVLREQVIEPIVAGVRSPRQGRKPKAWTTVDRDYEALRINMQTLFCDLGLTSAMSRTA
jgi:hypothetical protein